MHDAPIDLGQRSKSGVKVNVRLLTWMTFFTCLDQILFSNSVNMLQYLKQSDEFDVKHCKFQGHSMCKGLFIM